MTLAILDWKSGNFVGPEMALQLGGYAMRTHEKDELLGWQPVNGQRATEGLIVHVGADGVRPMLHLNAADLKTASEKFAEAVGVFRWMVDRGHVRVPEKEEYRMDGQQLVSVTYVIQHVIAKMNLLDWYYDIGIEAGLQAARLGLTPVQITAALEAKALLNAKTIKKTEAAAEPWRVVKKTLHEAGVSPTARRDARAGEGSHWHKTILFFLQGKTVDLSQAPESQSQMLAHFAMWSARVKLKPYKLETKVALAPLGVAGTFDAEAELVLPTRGGTDGD